MNQKVRSQTSIQDVRIDLTDVRSMHDNQFGDLVYMLRNITGVTDEQIAAHAGVTPSFVKAIQSSDSLPAADVGQLILQALGIETTRSGPLVFWEDGRNFIRFKTASRRNPKGRLPESFGQGHTILSWN